MSEDFLICRNCVNWGQPWLLHKKVVICEKKQDICGRTYTSQHPACKYFIPIVNGLPEDLQRIRLFVQTLTLTQKSYFAWALSQASLLLKIRDAKGQVLSLGDQVSFRLGLCSHTGTIEGVDLQQKKAVVVHSPVLIHSNISLLSESVTKITKEQAKEILKSYPDIKDKTMWHLDCLVQEISSLRARRDSLSNLEFSSLLLYERQLEALKLQTKQDMLMSSI